MSQYIARHGRKWRARYRIDGAVSARTFATEHAAQAWIDLLKLRRTLAMLPAIVAQIEVNDDGCWEWQGLTNNGYGRLSINGRHERVHRLMLGVHGVEIPSGFHIHHRCRNKLCVNPDHLEVLTPAEHGQRHRKMTKNVPTVSADVS